jgi:hypothetical protein
MVPTGVRAKGGLGNLQAKGGFSMRAHSALKRIPFNTVVAFFAAVMVCSAYVQFFAGPKKIDGYELSVNVKKSISLPPDACVVCFQFEAPGASGVAYVDGKKVLEFNDRTTILILQSISPGKHKFEVRLNKTATLKEIASAAGPEAIEYAPE